MECSQHIKDLLPDYHLGQLSPEEAAEVRRHLAEHTECREELEEISQVLDLMPFAVEPAAPSPTLKNRTLVRALAEEDRPIPQQETSGWAERREPGRTWRWPDVALLGVAAVVLVALLGLGWAYLGLQRENDRLQAEVGQLQEDAGGTGNLVTVAVLGTGRAPEARGTAVVDPSDGALALDVYNLPAAPTGHSYRAWLIGPDGTVSLGQMKTDGSGDGRMTGSVSGPVDAYDAVQITTEPVGAEDRSGPVYMRASL